MTPEQIRKDVDTTYIHVYPKNEKIICELSGNSIVLLAMIDRALTIIAEKMEYLMIRRFQRLNYCMRIRDV